MKKPILPLLLVLLFVTSGSAQVNLSRQYTQAVTPRQEALDRLNLKLAWRLYLPMDGRRDSILTVQALGDVVMVQLRSGALMAINAQTGKKQWEYVLDTPYRVTTAVGHNAKFVFAISGTRVVALDRATGQFRWEYDLGNVPSATPVADNEFLYVCLVGGKLVSYQLPKPEESGKGPAAASRREQMPTERQPGYDSLSSRGVTTSAVGPLGGARAYRQSIATGPQPNVWWSYGSGSRLEQIPLLTREAVVVAGSEGSFFALGKENGKPQYDFRTQSTIAAPPGQHGETAYVVSHDYNLYAMNMVLGRVMWQFAASSPISSQPWVTDDDIYLVPDQGGVFRLDRVTGQEIWRNRNAHRFMAVNPKYVYAADRTGRLLVLDRASGTELGVGETRDFQVPIGNEITDRLFLAANNGLFLCLHDRAYSKPVWNRKPEEKKPEAKKPEAKPPAGEGDSDAEKPKEGEGDKKDKDEGDK